MTITIKNANDIAAMRVAGRLASEVLDFITPYVKPGVTTNELDKLCHDYIVDLHLGQPPSLSRHPERQATQKRRLDEHRHHRHQGRLAR
jgi:methionyl aminopeptidase